MIQSIQRAAIIMRAFSEREPELGVTELSERLNLHKSTVSRILSTLQAEGLVYQNPETAKYSLGVGLVSLSGIALGRLSVRRVALEHMEELAQQTQESICLTTLAGDNGICTGYIPAPQSVRYVAWLGRRSPLYCTASGKIFFAYQEQLLERLILPTNLMPYTSKTETDSSRLSVQLRTVVAQGYATEHEEFMDGITAVAAPVFNHQRRLVGAISIAGPTFRVNETMLAQFIPLLLACTQAISIRLGYIGSTPD